MNPGMGHRPSAVLRVFVCECVFLSCGPVSAGETRLLPHFLALMSDRDHLMGLKTSVTCLYLAAVAATAGAQHCSCFPKMRGAIDDNEEGHFN